MKTKDERLEGMLRSAALASLKNQQKKQWILYLGMLAYGILIVMIVKYDIMGEMGIKSIFLSFIPLLLSFLLYEIVKHQRISDEHLSKKMEEMRDAFFTEKLKEIEAEINFNEECLDDLRNEIHDQSADRDFLISYLRKNK